MKTLNEVAEKFLQENGISIRHFADCIGCEYTMCAKWIVGKKNLKAEQIKKVHDFLSGKFFKSIEEIINEG